MWVVSDYVCSCQNKFVWKEEDHPSYAEEQLTFGWQYEVKGLLMPGKSVEWNTGNFTVYPLLWQHKNLVRGFWSSLVLFLGVLPCLLNYLGGAFLRDFLKFVGPWSVEVHCLPRKHFVHLSLIFTILNQTQYQTLSERNKFVDNQLYEYNTEGLCTHSFLFHFLHAFTKTLLSFKSPPFLIFSIINLGLDIG